MPATITQASPLTAKQWEPFAYQPFATGLSGDGMVGDFAVFEVFVATAAALTGSWTYSNGTAGVGATLTAPSSGSLTIDGRTVTTGDFVLVKDQASSPQNGVYQLTNDGSSTAAVLTRATAFDTAAEMVGFVRVLSGSTNVGRIYLWNSVLTVGTSGITFANWLNRWRSSPLPRGCTLNPATGKISATQLLEGGVFNIALSASDDSGSTWSTPMVFTLGIEPGPNDLHPDVGLDIDLQTRAVTVTGGPISLKSGDDRLLRVRFKSGGTAMDLGTLGSLKLALKEFDPEPVVELGGGTSSDVVPTTSRAVIGKIGSGSQAQYLLWIRLDDSKLTAALANNEADDSTTFTAKAEIEWTYPNATEIGPTTLTATTRTFDVEIVRQLN